MAETVNRKEKTLTRRVFFGAFNAFAAILASLLLMPKAPAAGKSWMVLPLVAGAVAGALGGFLYHRIVGAEQTLSKRIIGIAIYLSVVLAVFALVMSRLV